VGAGCVNDPGPLEGTVCDDGLYCNGKETCIDGSCVQSSGDPCENGPTCADACNEANNNCTGFDDPEAHCEADLDPCTIENCNGAGQCVFTEYDPSDDCQTPLVRCEGASLVPGFTKVVPLRRLKAEGRGFDKWKGTGEFTIPYGFRPFDPDSQKVTLIFNQTVTPIYSPVLPPGTFAQKGSEKRPRWLFRLRRSDPDVEGAEGLRKGKFSGAIPTGGKLLNRTRYLLKGGGLDEEHLIKVNPCFPDADLDSCPIDPGSEPRETQLRQTIVFSEPDEQGGRDLLCATVVLTCKERGRKGNAMKCFSQQFFTSPSGAFLAIKPGLFE